MAEKSWERLYTPVARGREYELDIERLLDDFDQHGMTGVDGKTDFVAGALVVQGKLFENNRKLYANYTGA